MALSDQEKVNTQLLINELHARIKTLQTTRINMGENEHSIRKLQSEIQLLESKEKEYLIQANRVKKEILDLEAKLQKCIVARSSYELDPVDLERKIDELKATHRILQNKFITLDAELSEIDVLAKRQQEVSESLKSKDTSKNKLFDELAEAKEKAEKLMNQR